VLHVVDGAHPDPEGQLAAVREVLGEIGAGEIPELVVVNKADTADPLTLGRLHRREPGAVVVSARSGAGLGELSTAIADRLPRFEVRVDVLLPYDRGDLVSRVHAAGEVADTEHTPAGTRLRAAVPAALAGELAPYAVS
jgi:GTP-binding protein HflX